MYAVLYMSFYTYVNTIVKIYMFEKTKILIDHISILIDHHFKMYD